MTPIKSIRAKCLECSNNQPNEVKFCNIPTCPLFYYRMGKNPNRKGMGGNVDNFKKSHLSGRILSKKGIVGKDKT